MQTKKTMLILVIGVVLIAGVIVVLTRPASRVTRGKPPVRAAAPAPAAPAKPAAATNAAPVLAATPVDRSSLEGRWLTWLRAPLRDPFLLQPPPPPKAVVAATPASQLKLTGLWVQTGSRLAVINGGVYGEEDVVMGFRILRIQNGPLGILVDHAVECRQAKSRCTQIQFAGFFVWANRTLDFPERLFGTGVTASNANVEARRIVRGRAN